MSERFFYRNRFKLAAFFYFVGFIQIIYFLVVELSPTISYLALGPAGLIPLLWSIMMNIGIGLLFLAVAWLSTIIPSPPSSVQIKEEKPQEGKKGG